MTSFMFVVYRSCCTGWFWVTFDVPLRVYELCDSMIGSCDCEGYTHVSVEALCCVHLCVYCVPYIHNPQVHENSNSAPYLQRVRPKPDGSFFVCCRSAMFNGSTYIVIPRGVLSRRRPFVRDRYKNIDGRETENM